MSLFSARVVCEHGGNGPHFYSPSCPIVFSGTVTLVPCAHQWMAQTGFQWAQCKTCGMWERI